MNVVLDALQVINLLAAALGAGGQVFCLRTLIPARRGWAPDFGTKVHQDAMTTLPDDYMKPAAAVAMATGLLIAVLERSGLPTLLTLLGVAGQVANAIISVRWEFPINREIVSWGNGPVPDRYPSLRDTWDQKHAWRTTASLFALACFILACVLRQRS
jgi:hypothetical protein